MRLLAAAWAAGGLLLPVSRSAVPPQALRRWPSALEAARALEQPVAAATKDGEFEGFEFWEEHDELLTQAWEELGPRNHGLYTFDAAFERRYLREELREAAAESRSGRGEGAALSLFEEVVPGVFASDALFTQRFAEDMLQELEHINGAGIPLRRPNGMNRYGVILDNVGMESMFEGLVAAYIRPLAAMLFPELVRLEDAEEHYAFSVRYEPSGDTELAKHADASVVTLNLCLGRAGWQEGNLRFFESSGSGIYALPDGRSAGAGDVAFRPGLALIHRGQHKHQALPLLSGQRTNIIVWLFARHGVVRVAPYAQGDQLSPEQRWRWPARAGEL